MRAKDQPSSAISEFNWERHNDDFEEITNLSRDLQNPDLDDHLSSTGDNQYPTDSSEEQPICLPSKKLTRDKKKIKHHILNPNSFLDTLAILVILLSLPERLAIGIQLLYILTLSPALRYLASTTLRNGPIPVPHYTNAKLLVIDLLIVIVTLCITPVLRNFVEVLAQAVVAATLGGQQAFFNAVYVTITVETLSLLQRILTNFFPHERLEYIIGFFAVPQLFTFSVVDKRPVITITTYCSSNGDDTAALSFHPFKYGSLITGCDSLRQNGFFYYLLRLVLQLITSYVICLGLSPFVWGDYSNLHNLGMDSQTSNTNKVYSTSQHGSQGTPIPMGKDYSSTNTEEDAVIIEVPLDTANSLEIEKSRLSLMESIPFLYQGKRSRKYVMVRINQPMWFMLASIIAMVKRPNIIARKGRLESPVKLRNLICNSRQYCSTNSKSSGWFLSHICENSVGFSLLEDVGNAQEKYIVCVNQVQWRQVLIRPIRFTDKAVYDIDEDVPDNEAYRDVVLITVLGLTGGTVYDIEILGGSETVIGKLAICTAQSKEVTSRQASLTPLSPATTLQDTLTHNQFALSETKNAIKRSRRDHAKKITSMYNEIEAIQSKAESSDKADGRARRKLLSLKGIVNQLMNDVEHAELKATELQLRKDALDKDYEEYKRQRQDTLETLEKRQKAKLQIKEGFSEKLAAMENEKNSLICKQGRLEIKRSRLIEGIENVESELEDVIYQEHSRREEARRKRIESRDLLFKEISSAICEVEQAIRDMYTTISTP